MYKDFLGMKEKDAKSIQFLKSHELFTVNHYATDLTILSLSRV